jgi:hypothetical protein
LRRLVAKAERERLDLVSLMAELSCEGSWARLLIPPFVFFFQKLYPFSWVSDRSRTTAAAAGGCVLLRAETLLAAGGFAVIKGALIDDCALAAHIKPVARARGRGIWLGLADDSHSLRPYRDLKSIWDMVARSAYTQLRTSPLLVAGSLLGMTLTYLVPPLALLAWPWHGSALAAAAGGLAWASMATAFLPTLRLYRQPPWLAGLLPVGALLYSLMTADSARQHWRGRGGAWKGRMAARALEDTVDESDFGQAAETPSGKGAGDENFPVGSWLLPARLRPHVAKFYAFARAIDDIADNPDLQPEDKIRRLDRFEQAIAGQETDDPALATAFSAIARSRPIPSGAICSICMARIRPAMRQATPSAARSR